MDGPEPTETGIGLGRPKLDGLRLGGPRPRKLPADDGTESSKGSLLDRKHGGLEIPRTRILNPQWQEKMFLG